MQKSSETPYAVRLHCFFPWQTRDESRGFTPLLVNPGNSFLPSSNHLISALILTQSFRISQRCAITITVCRGVCFSMRLAPPSQRASNIPRNQPAKKIFGPLIHHRKRLKRAALGRQSFPRKGSAKYFFFTQNANAPFMDALCPGGWAR